RAQHGVVDGAGAVVGSDMDAGDTGERLHEAPIEAFTHGRDPTVRLDVQPLKALQVDVNVVQAGARARARIVPAVGGQGKAAYAAEEQLALTWWISPRLGGGSARA